MNSQEMIASIFAQKYERDYRSLCQEFQEFQEALLEKIKAEIQMSTEKVTHLHDENRRIQTECDEEKMEKDTTIRELTREKTSNHCEIRTLREELEETRERLHEKTVENEFLLRKLDMISKPTSGTTCDIPSHTQLCIQLKAAEARTSFLETELLNLSQRSEIILNELDENDNKHHKRVQTLTSNVQNLELEIVEERQAFADKYNALKAVIGKHQAYIIELEKIVEIKDIEKQDALLEARDNIKAFMIDSINSLKIIEVENLAVINDRNRMNLEIKDLKRAMELKNQEMEKITLKCKSYSGLIRKLRNRLAGGDTSSNTSRSQQSQSYIESSDDLQSTPSSYHHHQKRNQKYHHRRVSFASKGKRHLPLTVTVSSTSKSDSSLIQFLEEKHQHFRKMLDNLPFR